MNSSHRNPVILIHGIFDTTAIFRKMSAYLTQQGWEVHCFNLIPNYGFLGLDRLAAQITDYVDRTFPPDQPIDLVGFSMGGLVSRYYVQRLGGIKRVQRLITISSPHNGTWTAYFYVTPGTLQMRPTSKFLKDLNQDIDLLDQINFTSLWTPLDVMIVPASSSQLPVGQEVQLNVLFHSWMVQDSQCLNKIAETLSAPVKTSRHITDNKM
ncbi:alpha/beta hydrolase fold family protein [Lyngbya aestuarii BL J]|uniref:Alpha/beta hydrolase fold family protein n=1 Tax=Lyngbya aestuarii BL J TaxID=1348334 RepID=U7QHB7_9CYAN|nr:triacylglycerol lipase [Lyngbya aestuarii]ERT05831.1 alpha/beta hydrolase fold family protein [Lyngbya aestuarii BL J]